ncbi:ArnT family glycosyltransferase [Frigidibacter sp. MR17.24]|uniref:ArnT family glycosyltransferase n=1 Tax=Frigidibacter sp. MR17.24 TaxID=3127345 RepID=UPI0030130B8C
MNRLTRPASALALLLALAAVVLLAGHFLPQLDRAGLNQYDEYHTLDRTLAAARGGHWSSVWSNHEPSFRKPPLQYWAGAGLILTGIDEILAMRLVAMGFGLTLLAATGALAAVVAGPGRGRATAAATAVLLLAASPMVWSQATAAMLDAGAALFTLVTGLGVALAVRRPRLIWIAVAGVFLGALQKAPVGLPLLFATLAALRIWRVEPEVPLRAAERRPLRRRARRIAVALVLAWPVFQALQHGFGAFRTSVVTEMAERFVPTVDDDTVGNWVSWVDWMIEDSAVLWFPALAAALTMPLWHRRAESVVIAAWTLIFLLGMTFADGDTYSRYLLMVLPFLATALSVGLVRAIRLPLLPALLGAGAVAMTGVATLEVNQPEPDKLARDALARELGTRVAPGDTLLFCRYYGGEATMNFAALSAFASAGQPVISITGARDLERARADGKLGSPVWGFCSDETLAELRDRLEGYEVVGTSGPWTAFRAGAVN